MWLRHLPNIGKSDVEHRKSGSCDGQGRLVEKGGKASGRVTVPVMRPASCEAGRRRPGAAELRVRGGRKMM